MPLAMRRNVPDRAKVRCWRFRLLLGFGRQSNMTTHRPSTAFTRIELIAVVAALALLTVIVAPLFGATREDSHRAACFNNLRQLGLVMLEYVDEHDDRFPPRAAPRWPEQLRPYYKSTAALLCPSDGPNPLSFGVAGTNSADSAPRSYLFNGWNDYYQGLPLPGSALPASAIQDPARTVLLGEKATESGHFWMDYWSGGDYSDIEQGRHLRTGSAQSGGSHFTFADGSVQFLQWGASFNPVNLWFIDTALRQMPSNPR